MSENNKNTLTNKRKPNCLYFCLSLLLYPSHSFVFRTTKHCSGFVSTCDRVANQKESSIEGHSIISTRTKSGIIGSRVFAPHPKKPIYFISGGFSNYLAGLLGSASCTRPCLCTCMCGTRSKTRTLCKCAPKSFQHDTNTKLFLPPFPADCHRFPE